MPLSSYARFMQPACSQGPGQTRKSVYVGGRSARCNHYPTIVQSDPMKSFRAILIIHELTAFVDDAREAPAQDLWPGDRAHRCATDAALTGRFND